MADEFNNQNNGNNQNYAQSANNDMQVQMAVDNAMAEQKKKKKKKRLIIFGVIAAVIVVIIIASSGGSSDNKVEDASSDAAQSQTTTQPAVTKIEAGKAVTIDDELKITFSSCNTNFTKYSDYEAPAKGNKVVSADFKIENVSSTDQYIDSMNATPTIKNATNLWELKITLIRLSMLYHRVVRFRARFILKYRKTQKILNLNLKTMFGQKTKLFLL